MKRSFLRPVLALGLLMPAVLVIASCRPPARPLEPPLAEDCIPLQELTNGAQPHLFVTVPRCLYSETAVITKPITLAAEAGAEKGLRRSCGRRRRSGGGTGT